MGVVIIWRSCVNSLFHITRRVGLERLFGFRDRLSGEGKWCDRGSPDEFLQNAPNLAPSSASTSGKTSGYSVIKRVLSAMAAMENSRPVRMNQPDKAPRVSTSFIGTVLFGAFVLLTGIGGLGVWAATARLDSAVVAPGKVAVESNRKEIQHLQGGIVKEILVRNAQPVKQGDLLVVLDRTQAKASIDGTRERYFRALALEARLLAERDGGDAVVNFPDVILRNRSDPAVQTIMTDQEWQFRERKASVGNRIGILEAQIAQEQELIAGTREQVQWLDAQILSYDAEIEAVRPAAKKGFYAKNRLAALERSRTEVFGRKAEARSMIARTERSIGEAKIEILQLRQEFVENVAEQLRQARLTLADARERHTIAADIYDRVELRAPQDGIIQNLTVHTLGGVVRPGETIMEIVPVDDNLIINARISPLDVDSLRTGMEAEVRFSSFTGDEVPTIFGRVEWISADIVIDDVAREEYFLSKIVVDEDSVPERIAEALTPGMPGDVIIATGERTTLDYLIQPLENRLIKAMREE